MIPDCVHNVLVRAVFRAGDSSACNRMGKRRKTIEITVYKYIVLLDKFQLFNM